MIKLIFVIFHPSYYNQVGPAISKQVEFLNGYMHADDAWHVFTNNIGGETYPQQTFSILIHGFQMSSRGIFWG